MSCDTVFRMPKAWPQMFRRCPSMRIPPREYKTCYVKIEVPPLQGEGCLFLSKLVRRRASVVMLGLMTSCGSVSFGQCSCGRLFLCQKCVTAHPCLSPSESGWLSRSHAGAVALEHGGVGLQPGLLGCSSKPLLKLHSPMSAGELLGDCRYFTLCRWLCLHSS